MGILQARILEWVATPSSRGSSWSRNRTQVSSISCIDRQIIYPFTTWEAQNKCVISFFGLFISLSNGNINVNNKPKRKLHAYFLIQIWRCYQSKAGILQCVRMWEVKRDPAQLCVSESLAEGSCDHLYSAGAGGEMQKDKHAFQTTHRVMWLGQESTCADCLFSAVLVPSSRKVARDGREISLLGLHGSECRFL